MGKPRRFHKLRLAVGIVNTLRKADIDPAGKVTLTWKKATRDQPPAIDPEAIIEIDTGDLYSGDWVLPTLIEVVGRGRHSKNSEHRLLIDGKPFPYVISEDGVTTTARNDEAPSITITLIAEEVRFVNDLDPPNASGPGAEARAKRRAELGIDVPTAEPTR